MESVYWEIEELGRTYFNLLKLEIKFTAIYAFLLVAIRQLGRCVTLLQLLTN